ncbi:MAG: RNA 3'-terminal phosphate cyclase [Thermoplasmata archaeon]|nr:RNA 3'-terminal phosphate cyclase [Thermoplasmata archaeon]
MEPDSILTIDGSFGEGGGQILRNALALSVLAGKGIRITDIRANRKNPGLRPQHLASVKGAALISNAVVEGAEIGSREVLFKPRRVTGGEYTIDIGTAGSITLLLQSLLPPLLSAPAESNLRITGGTDVPWSPPVDYLHFVFFPIIREMGAGVELTLLKRGFYPKGGGEVEVRIKPSRLLSSEFLPPENGAFAVRGRAFASNLPDHILERMTDAAERELKYRFGNEVEVEIEVTVDNGIGPGTGITLWTKGAGGRFCRLGASAKGERGIKAEEVGGFAAQRLIREIEGKGGLDIHAGDQLPVFTPLIDMGGKETRLHFTVREITPHLRTSLWVLEQFGYTTSTLYLDGFHIML